MKQADKIKIAVRAETFVNGLAIGCKMNVMHFVDWIQRDDSETHAQFAGRLFQVIFPEGCEHITGQEWLKELT